MFALDPRFRYAMPPYFGPLFESTEGTVYHDCQSLGVVYETDREALECYIPAEFELLRPEVLLIHIQCQQVDWLCGDGYNLVGVNLPVRCRTEDLSGILNLVMWENATEPILRGRETNGVPKIFADITDLMIYHPAQYTPPATTEDISNAAHVPSVTPESKQVIRTVLSHRGRNFLKLSGLIERQCTSAECQQYSGVENLFCWHCFPNIDRPGMAVDQKVLFPQESIISERYEVSAAVDWSALEPLEHPTQFHIIQSLANLPIKRVVNSWYQKMVCILHQEQCRVLKPF